ncbi:MAG: isopeptide-forming domain-containing fimbrial protein [Oscillospiraceae bacterium]|nr:isopeptide-forming domain-containing fimbrial protein [Oscillospiraceae bacterium]
MKKFSKFLSIALLVAMVLSLGIASAFASEDETTPPGSITVTGQKVAAGESTTTYEAYRIFDLAANDDYSALTYTINSDWSGFFGSGAAGAAYIADENDTTANGGDGYTPIVIGGAVKYIALTESNIADFGKAALTYSQTAGLTPVAYNTTGSFTGLPLGYYMVYPKGANINVSPYTSIVSLTTTKPDAEVVQKAEYPTLEKTDDDDSVEVGQTVHYTLTSKVPDTTGYETFTFAMHDQMTAGLTFDGVSSIAVTIENGDDDVTVPASGTGAYTFEEETPATGFATAFKISIPVMSYQDYVGKEIRVTYTATVNKDAVVQIDKNHAYLEYSNNPKDDQDHTETPPDEEIVYSAKIVINKFDGTNTNAKLAGAKFVLRCKSVTDTGTAAHAVAGSYYKRTDIEDDTSTADVDETDFTVSWVAETTVDDKVTAGNVALEGDVKNGATIVETDENGVASFEGLENGVYELIEVKAPAGYNQIKGVAKEISVSGSNASTESLSYTADVANNSGTELPSTGGIGTTIFYVVGGILIVAAGVLLVTKKRMSE